MLNADQESNWRQATNYERAVAEHQRQKREQHFVCPKCGAANRPGATIIESSEQEGWADCGVCSHHFKVEG